MQGGGVEGAKFNASGGLEARGAKRRYGGCQNLKNKHRDWPESRPDQRPELPARVRAGGNSTCQQPNKGRICPMLCQT